MAYRNRVLVDVMTENPMTQHELQALANTTVTLANTAAVHEIDGVEADLRVEFVASAHQHDSTDETQCRGCRIAAGDGWNSNNARQG